MRSGFKVGSTMTDRTPSPNVKRVSGTEKHYSPWVHSRQEPLEPDLKRAWDQDPVAVMETKSTPGVHGRKMESITKTNLSGYFGGAGGNRTKGGY
jgi:hypothetical protein